MKTKFLNTQNCHALLPNAGNLPIIRKLEECLQGINKQPGQLSGSIEALVHHNEKTLNKTIGSKRLRLLPINIAINSDISKRDIHITAMTGPESPYAKFHLSLQFDNGILWKIVVPLQYLLRGWGDANAGHQGYIHTVSQHMEKIPNLYDWKARKNHDSDEYFYVGITGRNWLLRLNEHIGEMHRGSRKAFHSAWRENLGLDNVLFISMLEEVNLSFEEAMNWEEKKVDKISYGPQGLNMIPGGFKGLKYLHKLRVIDSTDITLKERDAALECFMKENPRKGIPNPFISELWKDDEFYLKIMDSRPKTLSPEQVRKIRELGEKGMHANDIVDEVEALNIIQVKNVLAGKTYQRIE